jgi:glycosyltransferase involved in cell wall biosynthesis
MDQEQNKKCKDISIIVPLYNEEGSLEILHGRLTEVIEPITKNYEIIFVDDGSTDTSLSILNRLRDEDNEIKIIRFRKNLGKSAALYVGFGKATGDIVITMDADLQDDPDDIPKFVKKIREGFDLVAGWRNLRRDPFSKTFPSKIFNVVTSIVTGIEIHDFNCGFKAYKKTIIKKIVRKKGMKNIILYGELHRYFPALIARQGYNITEVSVKHWPRVHGESKYGMKRFFWGLWGLCAVMYSDLHLKFIHKRR